MAERFLLLSVAMAGLTGAGLLKNRVGAAAYVDAAAASVARTDTRSGPKDDDGDDREGR